MRQVLMVALGLWGGSAMADPFAVHEVARQMFDRMPDLVQSDAPDICGADAGTNPSAFYCTTTNTIYYRGGFPGRGQAAYEVAHLLGHAVQVQHGVADVALRQIMQRRDEEAALRGMVERQVNCIAGVLMARSGVPNIDIAASFGAEPFQNAHWGRDPVARGPHLPIGVEAVQQWLDVGYGAADVAACAVGEFSSDLLVTAQRSG